MSDPAYLAAAGLSSLFAKKALSPVELLEAHLSRIRDYNGAVNAFAHLDEPGARAAARRSEERWRNGTPLGPLDGLTFTVKDNLPIAGFPSRRGSLTTTDAPMKETAPIVARCLEAGATFLGTTTMPEFAMGPITISPLTGITRNPWDTTRHSGGSSGGAAAGVSAGFCTFAVASDAGGSIRIPAALTGTVGFKPTGGRVPMYPPSVAGALSCNGPITHCVADAALVLNVATRADARDPMALPCDGSDYVAACAQSIKGARAALSLTLGYARKIHPEIAQAAKKAAATLADLGVTVDERDPEVEDPIDAYLALLRGAVRYSLRNLTPDQRALLSPGARDILEGPETTLADYLGAQEKVQVLARRMSAFHERYDFLLTPTVAAPAFAVERTYPADYESFPNRRAWTPFTSLCNLTQQPAISVPAGLTAEGLPIGLHIVAARNADATVLRAAAAYEQAAGFTARPRIQRST